MMDGQTDKVSYRASVPWFKKMERKCDYQIIEIKNSFKNIHYAFLARPWDQTWMMDAFCSFTTFFKGHLMHSPQMSCQFLSGINGPNQIKCCCKSSIIRVCLYARISLKVFFHLMGFVEFNLSLLVGYLVFSGRILIIKRKLN